MRSVIPLLDFIAEHHGDVAQIELLKNRFLKTTPTRSLLPVNCANLNAGYNLSPTNQQISYEIKQLIISRNLLSLIECVPHVIKENFGCDLTPQVAGSQASHDKVLYFLLKHALGFDIAGLDACAPRASLASIKLFESLKGAGLTICLRSDTSRDHFIITLGSKSKGWYVYDPLTNPELIFEHDFYTKNILTKFPKVKNESSPYSKTLTEADIVHCNTYWEKASAHISELLTSAPIPTLAELLNDPVFIRTLQRVVPPKTLSDNRVNQLIRGAITLFREQQEQLALESPMHRPQ